MSIPTLPDAQETPLSTNFQHMNSTVVSAYETCCLAERDILIDLESPSHTKATRAPLEAQLVYVRLLGHLMDKGPGDAAASHIAVSVIGAENRERLFEVGKLYLEHFVRSFWKAKGPTPVPSRHQSRPSFNTIQDMIKERLIPYPKNHQEAKRSALARDNFRCAVSGAFHKPAVKCDAELKQEFSDNPAAMIEVTDCCHILSESADLNLAAHDKGSVLKSFGYTRIFNDLEGSNVHSLKNVITMSTYMHDMFDTLALWFEATDKPNYYKVCSTEPEFLFVPKNVPRFVKFESTSPELELPSSEYLGLHAACCRVAHMSGAAGYLKMLDDLDDDWNYNISGSPENLAHALTAKLYHIQPGAYLVN